MEVMSTAEKARKEETEYYKSLYELEDLRESLDGAAWVIDNISKILGVPVNEELLVRIMIGRKRKALKGLITREINELKRNRKIMR